MFWVATDVRVKKTKEMVKVNFGNLWKKGGRLYQLQRPWMVRSAA
jgi:hypothetical protein